MGKYLPVIVTAKCGSLTRAGQILGYAQPNLGHIVTRFENELGVKLFVRDQRGVRLTEVGSELLGVMQQVEALEEQMQEIASRSKRSLLRVGVFQAAAQWMPEAVEAMRQEFPETMLEIQYIQTYLEGELGVKNDTLDCAFFCGTPPAWARTIPLLEDRYYLVVSERSPLAERTEVDAEDVAGKYPFIITEHEDNLSGPVGEVHQLFARSSVVKNLTQGIETALALVERDVGVSIVSGLDLRGMSAEQKVKVLDFQKPLTRTVRLLYSKEAEQSPLLTTFLRLVRKRVEEWKQEQGL